MTQKINGKKLPKRNLAKNVSSNETSYLIECFKCGHETKELRCSKGIREIKCQNCGTVNKTWKQTRMIEKD